MTIPLSQSGGGVSGILPASKGGVANVVTATQGHFFGQGVWDNTVSGTATIISPTGANNVLVFEFILPFRTTVRKVVFTNGTTVTAAATASFGIYDRAGNLLIDSGAFSTAVASLTVSNTLGAAVTLDAGVYYFAQACTNATNNAAGQIMYPSAAIILFTKNVAARCGLATNAYNGTALPATLGAIAGFTNRGPVAVLFEP